MYYKSFKKLDKWLKPRTGRYSYSWAFVFYVCVISPVIALLTMLGLELVMGDVIKQEAFWVSLAFVVSAFYILAMDFYVHIKSKKREGEHK